MEPIAAFLLGLAVIAVMAVVPWVSGVIGTFLAERDADNDDETILDTGANWFFRGMVAAPISALIILIVVILLLH